MINDCGEAKNSHADAAANTPDENRIAVIPPQFCAALCSVAIVPLSVIKRLASSVITRPDAPCQHNDTADDMRRESLPVQQAELGNDICDEEDGNEPRVSVAYEVKVASHARDTGVPDIVAVEESGHI